MTEDIIEKESGPYETDSLDEIYPRVPMADEIKILATIDDALKVAENDRANTIVRMLKMNGFDIVSKDIEGIDPTKNLVVDIRFVIPSKDLAIKPSEVLAETLREKMMDQFRGVISNAIVIYSTGGPLYEG